MSRRSIPGAPPDDHARLGTFEARVPRAAWTPSPVRARRVCSAGRMRIAILTDYYFPQLGGISEHVHGEAWHLTRRGHEVTVVTGRLLHRQPVVDEAESPQRDEP